VKYAMKPEHAVTFAKKSEKAVKSAWKSEQAVKSEKADDTDCCNKVCTLWIRLTITSDEKCVLLMQTIITKNKNK